MRRIVQPRNPRTCLHAHMALGDLEHLVQTGQVHDNAAFHRHALTVVSSAAAAQGERQFVFGNQRGNLHHLIHGLRHNQQIANLVLELVIQNWTVPKIVARARGQVAMPVVKADAVECGLESVQIRSIEHHGSP